MNEVDRAWEHERIRDLLAAYCQCLDEYDIDGVANCFTSDARADYGPGRGGLLRGRSAIAQRIAEGQAAFKRTHHQMGQVRIKLKTDSADTICYQMAWHERHSGLRELVCLRYVDQLVLLDNSWLIDCRRVEATFVDGFEGVPWRWVKRGDPLR